MFEGTDQPPWPHQKEAHPSRIAAMARQTHRADIEKDRDRIDQITYLFNRWPPLTQKRFMMELERLRHDTFGKP